MEDVIITLMFILQHYHCSGAYFQPMAESKVTQPEANQLCGSSDLPRINTVNDHRQLTAYLEQNEVTAVWLIHERISFENYKWLDGTIIDAALQKIGTQVGHSCGVLDIALAKYDFHSCSEPGLSYLCEIKDCTGCSTQGVTDYDCKTHGGTCYIFYCGVSNWYAANVRCRNIGGSLAILKDKNILKLFTHFWNKSFLGPCMNSWIGFHREAWGNTEYSSVSLWAEGEPSGEGNCSVVQKVGEDYLWASTPCNDTHEVVCLEKENSGKEVSERLLADFKLGYAFNTTSPPTSNAQGRGKVTKDETPNLKTAFMATVIALVVCIFVITAVCVFCLRKGKYKKLSQAETEL